MRTFLLKKPVDAAALAVLRCELASAVDGGERDATIDIDDVVILESAVIAALLEILRLTRERGATVSLCARRPQLLQSLRITALDKVFTVVTCENIRPPSPAGAVKRRRVAGAPAPGARQRVS